MPLLLLMLALIACGTDVAPQAPPPAPKKQAIAADLGCFSFGPGTEIVPHPCPGSAAPDAGH